MGLTRDLQKHYSSYGVYPARFALAIAYIITAIALHLLIPIPIPVWLILIASLIVIIQVFSSFYSDMSLKFMIGSIA
jgi:hypothetical protein